MGSLTTEEMTSALPLPDTKKWLNHLMDRIREVESSVWTRKLLCEAVNHHFRAIYVEGLFIEEFGKDFSLECTGMSKQQFEEIAHSYGISEHIDQLWSIFREEWNTLIDSMKGSLFTHTKA